MVVKMKCCICGKEIDINKNEIPATWFGKYTMSGLVEVICSVCVKKPENEKRWMKVVVKV
jgi:hypothetical protein